MIIEKRDFGYYNFSDLDFFQKATYYFNIYTFLNRLIFEYPNFQDWYKNLFDEKFELKKDREIIICHYGLEFAGIAILKKSDSEKKICTIRVKRKYRNMGIAKHLIERSIEWLETEKPLVTLHKCKEREFAALFDYFGFQLEQKCKGYYSIFNSELVFNGNLPEQENGFIPIEICDIRALVWNCIENGIKSSQEISQLYIEWWARREIDMRQKLKLV